MYTASTSEKCAREQTVERRAERARARPTRPRRRAARAAAPRSRARARARRRRSPRARRPAARRARRARARARAHCARAARYSASPLTRTPVTRWSVTTPSACAAMAIEKSTKPRELGRGAPRAQIAVADGRQHDDLEVQRVDQPPALEPHVEREPDREVRGEHGDRRGELPPQRGGGRARRRRAAASRRRRVCAAPRRALLERFHVAARVVLLLRVALLRLHLPGVMSSRVVPVWAERERAPLPACASYAGPPPTFFEAPGPRLLHPRRVLTYAGPFVDVEWNAVRY